MSSDPLAPITNAVNDLTAAVNTAAANIGTAIADLKGTTNPSEITQIAAAIENEVATLKSASDGLASALNPPAGS